MTLNLAVSSGERVPSRPRIRAGLLQYLMEAVAAIPYHGQTELLLQEFAGFGIEDPYAWISLDVYLSFFERGAGALQLPALGIDLARTFSPKKLGPLGILFVNAGTLAEGFSLWEKFSGTWQEGTKMQLASRGLLASWTYKISDLAVADLCRQDAEFTLAFATSWIRSRLGPGWTPEEVHFAHPAPTDTGPHYLFFGCPIRFGREDNKLVFAASDLGREICREEPDFVPYMRRHLADLMEPERDLGIAEQVRFEARSLLGRHAPTLNEIAARLRLSPRTLQRRLAIAGTSLRDVIKEERLTRSLSLLGKSPIPGEELAQALGYSEASSAVRAVRNWTGEPPGRFGQTIRVDGIAEHARLRRPRNT